MQQIVVDDLTLLEKIGKGGFGEVYLSRKKNIKGLFATKKIPSKSALDPQIKKYFDTEIEILKNFSSHENIIKLFEIKRTQNNFYLVLEYCNGGDLENCLKSYSNKYGKSLGEAECRHIIKQVVKALVFLSKYNIVHRDIKLENLMLQYKTEEDRTMINVLAATVKLIDFGFAKTIDNEMGSKSTLGSPLTMAPEILRSIIEKKSSPHNNKADMWSLGVISYNLLCGNLPFVSRNYHELYDLHKNGKYYVPLNLKLSKQALTYLTSLLQYNPEVRESVNKLPEYDFLKVTKADPYILENIPKENKNNESLILSIHNNRYEFLAFNKESYPSTDTGEANYFNDYDFSLYELNRFNATPAHTAETDFLQTEAGDDFCGTPIKTKSKKTIK